MLNHVVDIAILVARLILIVVISNFLYTQWCCRHQNGMVKIARSVTIGWVTAYLISLLLLFVVRTSTAIGKGLDKNLFDILTLVATVVMLERTIHGLRAFRKIQRMEDDNK